MPAFAERSLSVAISGAEVCSELAKPKAGGPRMHRGPFASVWIVALVGDGPRAPASGRESIVVLYAAKHR